MLEDPLTEKVLGAAMEVHSHLGAGLLQSVYEECLCRELALRGMSFQRQVVLPVEYKGISLDCGYRLDLLLPDSLIVEVKSVERLLPVHQAQLITYPKTDRHTCRSANQLQCGAPHTGNQAIACIVSSVGGWDDSS